jgi:hypothetical protein
MYNGGTVGANNPGNIGSGGISIGSFASPKKGPSFSAGITRRQAINQYWNWQLSLRYQYLSYRQPTGRSYDSLTNYFSQRNDASQAYYAGNTATHSSHTHQVQIVPGISYWPNPQSHLPIGFTIGVPIGYAVSSSLLLPNPQRNAYMNIPGNNRRFLLSAEAGISVSLYKTVQAGLLYQHGFTGISKTSQPYGFRWRQWQLQVGLPLSLHHP